MDGKPLRRVCKSGRTLELRRLSSVYLITFERTGNSASMPFTYRYEADKAFDIMEDILDGDGDGKGE